MKEVSPADGSPRSSRKVRGRPRKESLEKENLSKVLESNISKDVSARFLQKMKLLEVEFLGVKFNLILRRSES
jgi:hypothetical protein